VIPAEYDSKFIHISASRPSNNAELEVEVVTVLPQEFTETMKTSNIGVKDLKIFRIQLDDSSDKVYSFEIKEIYKRRV
jgi:hypothetical protein